MSNDYSTDAFAEDIGRVVSCKYARVSVTRADVKKLVLDECVLSDADYAKNAYFWDIVVNKVANSHNCRVSENKN